LTRRILEVIAVFKRLDALLPRIVALWHFVTAPGAALLVAGTAMIVLQGAV
jgi:hypothetical protein